MAREHGLLNRVLVIYDEANRRLRTMGEFDQKHVADAAEIIRRFIENYHEKLEEQYLFPRFERAKKLTELVSVLRQQHQAGRRLTPQILHVANASTLKNTADRRKLSDLLSAFVRMYRPHEACEDTVLFPKLRPIISGNEYDSLGEEFEKKGHDLFGKEGLEGMLEKVAGVEKAMGIYDLSQFTPR